MEESETVNLLIKSWPGELHEELRKEAAAQGRSLKWCVRQAVEEWLRRQRSAQVEPVDAR